MLNVYFEGRTSSNEIITENGEKIKSYEIGEMVLELLDTDVRDDLTVKVSQRIDYYINHFDNVISKAEIDECLRYVNDNCLDLDRNEYPIAFFFFSNSFGDAVNNIGMKTEVSYKKVSDFLKACRSEYIEIIDAYYDLLKSVVATESNNFTEYQSEIASLFMEIVFGKVELLAHKCRIRRKYHGEYIKEPIEISDIFQLLILEYSRLFKAGKKVKQCPNCEKYFIAGGNKRRIDAIYCSKICSDTGAKKKRQSVLETNVNERKYHNEMSKFGMRLLNWSKDRVTFKSQIEQTMESINKLKIKHKQPKEK